MNGVFCYLMIPLKLVEDCLGSQGAIIVEDYFSSTFGCYTEETDGAFKTSDFSFSTVFASSSFFLAFLFVSFYRISSSSSYLY